MRHGPGVASYKRELRASRHNEKYIKGINTAQTTRNPEIRKTHKKKKMNARYVKLILKNNLH